VAKKTMRDSAEMPCSARGRDKMYSQYNELSGFYEKNAGRHQHEGNSEHCCGTKIESTEEQEAIPS
jgi:hypothetical protein